MEKQIYEIQHEGWVMGRHYVKGAEVQLTDSEAQEYLRQELIAKKQTAKPVKTKSE